MDKHLSAFISGKGSSQLLVYNIGLYYSPSMVPLKTAKAFIFGLS